MEEIGPKEYQKEKISAGKDKEVRRELPGMEEQLGWSTESKGESIMK